MRAPERTRPDFDGDPERGRWLRTLEAASQMTGPLLLVGGYAVSRLAVFDGWIPARWDIRDWVAGVLLLASAFFLVALRLRRVAEYSAMRERQRIRRSSGAAGGESTLPAVRKLERRVEMLEIQREIENQNIAAMCRKAGMPEMADNIMLRLVRDTSGDRTA